MHASIVFVLDTTRSLPYNPWTIDIFKGDSYQFSWLYFAGASFVIFLVTLYEGKKLWQIITWSFLGGPFIVLAITAGIEGYLKDFFIHFLNSIGAALIIGCTVAVFAHFTSMFFFLSVARYFELNKNDIQSILRLTWSENEYILLYTTIGLTIVIALILELSFWEMMGLLVIVYLLTNIIERYQLGIHNTLSESMSDLRVLIIRNVIFIAILIIASSAGASQFGSELASVFTLFFIGLLACYLLYITKGFVSYSLLRINTVEDLKQIIFSEDPKKQEKALRHFDHSSLKLSDEDFLDLLREVELSIQAGAAANIYWKKRYDIEQRIRQNRIGD